MGMLEKIEGEGGISLLPPRIALGSSMIYHGTQKLTPKGLEHAGNMFEQLGLKPAKPLAMATGLTELIAGALSILGIGTRLAALGVLVTQAVAVSKVHLPKGFSMAKSGFEFNSALMAIAAGLLLSGPGDVSLKGVLHGKHLSGKHLRKHLRPTMGHRLLAVFQ
ncbi:MAG: DoxX family protein [Myxococcaceae bacterium]|nr:DoxX family protein [Myxococcaceae bacterium]